MRRGLPLLLALMAAVLVAVGVGNDRALAARTRQESDRARKDAREGARLQALAVRAAIAQVEQAVGAGTPPEGVTAERLALPPSESPALPPASYGTLPREELAALLSSRSSTSQQLPEAVVAALAFGTEEARRSAAERLLSGELPVRPQDLPVLAAELGKGDDPRAERLAAKLKDAPDPDTLPRLPAFRRRMLPSGNLEGWAVDDRSWVRYATPAERLLALAGSPVGVAIDPGTGGDTRLKAAVPDVAGLALLVTPGPSPVLRLRIARAVLWAAIGSVLVALAFTGRALRREHRAVAREKAFLSSVTHELRTPLAAMRVLGETLAEQRGDPVEYGRMVAQETERLEELVEQVLAAARADQAPRFAPVEPLALARSALDLVRGRAERRDVDIRLLETQSPPEAAWDAEAVRRALLNLLDNAIRHGASPGHVTLSVGADAGSVRLAVSDDGPGIARRDRPHIFERFARGATRASGTGLGLYLVDQVARSHGGRVDLETAEGHGSTFTLVLPLRPAVARERPTP